MRLVPFIRLRSITTLILTLDGVGEWTTTSLAIGKNNQIEIIKESVPHSLDFCTQRLLTTSALRSTLVK